MKNYGNRTSLILLVVLMMACTSSADRVLLVGSDAYASRACWFDRQGDFVAFMALARDERLAVPYFISTSCMVDGDYSSPGEATIHHLGTIRMIDSFGSLQRALPGVVISDNVRTDQPLPSAESGVHYFKARLASVPNSNRTIYAPREVIELTELNISFERFLGLSRDQREAMLSDYDQGN